MLKLLRRVRKPRGWCCWPCKRLRKVASISPSRSDGLQGPGAPGLWCKASVGQKRAPMCKLSVWHLPAHTFLHDSQPKTTTHGEDGAQDDGLPPTAFAHAGAPWSTRTVPCMGPAWPWGGGTEGSVKVECWRNELEINWCERECLKGGNESTGGHITPD